MRSAFSILVSALYICSSLQSIFRTAETANAASSCRPSYKAAEDTNVTECVGISNRDVLRAMHWLAQPPKTTCSKVTTVQGLSVCEDFLFGTASNHTGGGCVVWSVISSNWCDHFGSLAFEKYWSERGCMVTVFHYYITFRGNVCSLTTGRMKDYPNITVVRLNMWLHEQQECFNCFYRQVMKYLPLDAAIDVLKVQGREGVLEDFDGVQFTVLADLFHRLPSSFPLALRQVVVTVSLSVRTLTDFVGRESEHAWNMFAAQKFLSRFASFRTHVQAGPTRLRPIQFSDILEQARLDPGISYYQHSFLRVDDPSVLSQYARDFASWEPWRPTSELRATVPGYCRPPSEPEDEQMQRWIRREMNVRCHPTRLTVGCVRDREYDAFLPCRQELMNHLAEDYAASKGWCDFSRPEAAIQPLYRVDAGAEKSFRQPRLQTGVRLAFFFTIYTDFPFVKRLLSRLYSSTHYYLLHIDASPGGVAVEFEADIRSLASGFDNVHVAKDVPIVYGASTASILLTRAMAWFNEHASGWDYFVCLTGSDYPLVPLHRIELILSHQHRINPMPFVMGWTPGTSTHIFRLQKTFPLFEQDSLIAKSIDAVTLERGKLLGAVPMEFRSNNFGPPLFCNNASNFAHLDNRQNKSGRIHETQWLFPKDIYPRRGRAIAEEAPHYSTPSFDGRWRVWKKSDPATTGAYDPQSVQYIVNSTEGRKYFHFFKHMLLGSEEHYYISLLYNWPRTKSFVQTLSAEIVWNTWELGLWEPQEGFLTHTHFLTMNEWDILHGFAKRGMMFARKFSSLKTAALLDAIDDRLLLNSTTDAGLYWPGFFDVDITTPGKQWVAMYRRNQSLQQTERMKGVAAARTVTGRKKVGKGGRGQQVRL